MKSFYVSFMRSVTFFIKCMVIGLCMFSIQEALFAHNDMHHKHTGKSFLQTRPVSMRIAMKNHLWLEHILERPSSSYGFTYAVVPFFFTSFLRSDTNGYFFPEGKQSLSIVGDSSDQKSILYRDIRAEYLSLPSHTNVACALRPSYKQTGIMIELNQSLAALLSFEFFSDWHIGVRVPLLVVEHMLDFLQYPLASNDIPDVQKAFANSRWYAQKIKKESSSTGVGDLDFYIGSPYYAKDHFIFATHSGIIIPTAPRAAVSHLFSPARGNEHRCALYGGIDMQIVLNKDPLVWHVSFFTSLESYYLFHTDTTRTFDLKGKPLSRFLTFNKMDDPDYVNIPGVNVLTFRAHMRSQAYGELSCGWRCMSERVIVECGYNVWGHDAERVKYIDQKVSSLYGIAGSEALKSASESTIAKKTADDQLFVPITINSIDLTSAACTSALTHGFHFAIGAFKKGKAVDGFIGCGGTIEKGQRHASMPQWGVWVKIGATL